MGSHPANLTLRFILELSVLISSGAWGYKQGTGFFKILLAIFIPALLATIWGVFAVPDDPSRSGNTVIATPGIVRLFMELAIFAFGTWTFYSLGYSKIGYVFGAIVLLHYILSYDRVLWLVSQ